MFWDNFVYCYCEGASHFTFSVSAALSQDDFVATGRILTHQFIQTGTLPLQISEAIIRQAVVGQVSEVCLIQSFLKLLHEKERGILQKALLGLQPLPTEDVIDILCDYGITSVPNTSNIKKIILHNCLKRNLLQGPLCVSLNSGKEWVHSGMELVAKKSMPCTAFVLQPTQMSWKTSR